MTNLNILENNDMTIEELAYQLTAYEKWGCIDYEEGLCDLIVSDYIEQAEAWDVISKYNEYLDETGYTDDIIYYNDDDFFLTFFDNSNPLRIVQATYFGHYNYNDDYVKFNGYGNLDSFNEWTILDEIRRDTDFLKWLLENEEVFEELQDEENKEIIIEKALELVKEGY